MADVRQNGLDREAEFEAYLPLNQAGAPPGVYFAVRTLVSPNSLVTAVKRVFSSLDSTVPVSTITMEDLLSAWLAPRRFTLTILGVFAFLALVLAVAGIYGVLSYLVAQRTQEIGVRIAIGAAPHRILLWVMRDALLWTVGGCVVGTGLALALSRTLSAFVYGVSSTDLITIVLVALLMLVASMLASAVPAIRALKIDPISALREQ